MLLLVQVIPRIHLPHLHELLLPLTLDNILLCDFGEGLFKLGHFFIQAHLADILK